jgi:hypothetical protein
MTWPPLSPRATIVRGSPQRITAFREQLQIAYLRAVAAAAGCGVARPDPDEGVDAQISYRCPGPPMVDARLDVQLKTTTADPAGGFVQAEMNRMRFDEFAATGPDLTVHKIVIIMRVPEDPGHWVYARDKGLTLHRGAYWVNLAGQTTSAKKKVKVKAPLDNLFDDVALCQIMQRIAAGGAP